MLKNFKHNNFKSVGNHVLVQLDQFTWSALTFTASLFVIRNNSLQVVGQVTLVLTLTYANLNILKNKFLLPELGIIRLKHFSGKNIVCLLNYRRITFILTFEIFSLIGLLYFLLPNFRIAVELGALFAVISIRDINRTINIFCENFSTNIWQNSIGLLAVTLLHFSNAYFMNSIDNWIFGILFSLVFPIFLSGSSSFQIFREVEKNYLDASKQRVLVTDSLVTQIVNVTSSILLATLSPVVMGQIAVNYNCFAALAITMGTGLTGKMNLSQLNSRVDERSIFKKYIFSQSVLLLNLLFVYLFRPLVEIFIGNNFANSERLILPTFLLYSTVLFVQFYAFPLLLNGSLEIFSAFRILALIAAYCAPLMLTRDYSVEVICLIQFSLFSLIFFISRKELSSR